MYDVAATLTLTCLEACMSKSHGYGGTNQNSGATICNRRLVYMQSLELIKHTMRRRRHKQLI